MARIRQKTISYSDNPNTYTFAQEAQEFDSTSHYSKGEYCIYNGDLYRFTSDKSPGAWNSGSVTSAFLGNDLANLTANLESAAYTDTIDHVSPSETNQLVKNLGFNDITCDFIAVAF